MMDFIIAPLIVGIVTLGIYKLFELFVCKKERLTMIEKLGDKLNNGDIISNLSLNLNYSRSKFTFGALKGGCLMLGIGLGLLLGFFICISAIPNYAYNGDFSWEMRQAINIIYGACVLLFGGAGLLGAFLVEIKLNKKEKE